MQTKETIKGKKHLFNLTTTYNNCIFAKDKHRLNHKNIDYARFIKKRFIGRFR